MIKVGCLICWVEGSKMFSQPAQVISEKPHEHEAYSVIRPGFWRLSTAACSIILSTISSILIARSLGPSAFGIYMFVLWLATVAVPVIGVGTSTVTSRHIADIQSREKPQVVAGVFRF